MVDLATLAISSEAFFSDCKSHRYSLTRRYKRGVSAISFLMLNPSTATTKVNDPTIHRCEALALREGFSLMHIINLFSFRATDPKDMKYAHEMGVDVTGGEENNKTLERVCKASDIIVCAWGNHGSFLSRSDTVMRNIIPEGANTRCLAINASGEPKHPLYTAKNAELIPYVSKIG